MANIAQVGTTTTTNTNLNTATLVHTQTNTTRIRKLFVNIFIDQVKGGGDYTGYLTVQRAGAGSFYESIKTTKTVGAGITANYFGSIPITLNATDVLRVYVLGLSTDNDGTADVIVDVNEEFANLDASGNPTPNDSSGVTTILADYARRTGDYATAAAAGTDAASKVLATPANKLVTDASGRVDLVDAPNATALAAIWAVATRTLTAISDSAGVGTLLTRLSAARASYLDFLAGWTTTIFAQIAGVVWGYASRTLTQSAAVTAAQVAGSDIAVLRGDSMSAPLTGLGNISAYVSLDFTVKAGIDDADPAAIIRIRKNLSGLSDGLLVLNGATATTPADGSITIDDATLGNITIALKAVDTAQLDIGLAVYDVQMITATGVTTLASGSFTVTSDVTRAIA